MTPIHNPNCNRVIGKPKDWDETLDGPCAGLPVYDHIDVQSGCNFMWSFWKPDADELKLLNEGKCIALGVSGKLHPVLMVGIEA